MQTLRKQTILSTIFIMSGYLFGAITILLYTKYNAIDKEVVGLTKIMGDFGLLVVSFASLGSTAVLYKFYPYFNDNLKKKENDLFSIVVLCCLIGFIIFCVGGYFLKPLFIQKYSAKSPLIIEYYPYLFVYGFGMLLFILLESMAFVLHKSSISNLLKETGLRFLTVLLLVLSLFKVIKTTQSFILLFSLQFLILSIIFFFYFKNNKEIYFTTKISRVTKKFWKKMLNMQSLVFSGFVIMTLASIADSLILGTREGQKTLGDFAIVQYGANLVGLPTKAIIGASVGVLTQFWKDKNMSEINRVYSRSCINLSLMALFLFGIIWLNAIPLIDTLGINETWKIGMNTMFLICVARTIEASTGVNNLIIGTSTFWRFEFFTGIILLAIRFPTAYFLISKYGLIGSGISDIISIIIYNFIRFEFLRKKFNMQPFNYKNILAILLAVIAYFIAFYSCKSLEGFVGIFARTAIFVAVFIAGVFGLNLTPDATQLYNRWVKKIKD